MQGVRQEAVTAGYPEKVIELLDKNPETVQFVEDYGKKKDQAPAATVEAEDGYSGMFPRSSNGMKDGDILHTERVLLQ